MNRKILYYGLFAGLISSSLFIGLMLTGNASMEHFDNGAIYGFTLMFLAFSLTFVCIKNIRDKDRGGVISFGQAFKIGAAIALIASTVYVAVWMIDLHYFNPDFAAKYAEATIKNLRASGASEAKIAESVKQMDQMRSAYGSPIGVALLTYLEILPIGLLVSLIAAWILKKKAA